MEANFLDPLLLKSNKKYRTKLNKDRQSLQLGNIITYYGAYQLPADLSEHQINSRSKGLIIFLCWLLPDPQKAYNNAISKHLAMEKKKERERMW